jgi:zinc protease
MTRTTHVIGSLLLALVVAAPATSQTGDLKLPPYKKARLKNGMTVLLMEQHKVPIISFSLAIRAGSVADPSGKEGIASLTAALLRKGTKTRSAEQFSSELDFIGGTFGAGAAVDSTAMSSEFMKKDISKGLDLLSDALMRPTFPPDEFTKLVAQRIDAVKSAKDRAQGVLGMYFNAYLYGKHPYARPSGGDERTLAAISRDEVVKFYESNYAPGNVILAVAGDFATADMEKQLTDIFGAWPSKTTPALILAEATPVAGKKLLLIDKPDSTQTFFRIGNVGISRTNPDRITVDIVNTLFGGRFTSMINSELRIKSGLTYGAGSSFAEWKARGPFAISSYTANANTEKAIDLTLEVLKRLHEKGITDDELKSAKAYMKGQFPPEVETTNQLAEIISELEFYGLDQREIDTYYAKIDGATMADVNRVIKQHFPLDNLVFTLIGKASEIERIAKKYAPVMDRKSIGAAGY